MTEKNQPDPNLSEFVHEYDVGLAREEGVPIRLLNAQTLSIRKAAERDKAAAKLNALKLRRKTLEDRQAALEAIPADTTKTLWCADYTEDLSGAVGTVEIPGEGQESVIIVPDYQMSAAYQAARDGQLFFREGMTGPQAYYNAAILPGWQRHMPTFRVGVISAINYAAHTATVTLDSVTSSAYSLPINRQATFTAVPIEYMQCDSEPFENGDRVVVQFVEGSWDSPRIVGFESNPRPCPVNWPPLLFPLSQFTDAADDSEAVPVTNFNNDWKWWSTDTCQTWYLGSFDGTFMSGRTQPYRLGPRYFDVRVLQLDESDVEVDEYRATRNLDGEILAWDKRDDDAGAWVSVAAPDVVPVWPDLPPLVETENTYQISGQVRHDYVANPNTFAFRQWIWPEAVTGIDAPHPVQCSSPDPTFTEISGLIVNAGYYPNAVDPDLTAIPPPGWSTAANPRYDYPDGMVNPPFFWRAVEEDLRILSTTPAVPADILAWVQTETDAPASFITTTTIDAEEYARRYDLVGVEYRLNPGAVSTGYWCLRYEATEPGA